MNWYLTGKSSKVFDILSMLRNISNSIICHSIINLGPSSAEKTFKSIILLINCGYHKENEAVWKMMKAQISHGFVIHIMYP